MYGHLLHNLLQYMLDAFMALKAASLTGFSILLFLVQASAKEKYTCEDIGWAAHSASVPDTTKAQCAVEARAGGYAAFAYKKGGKPPCFLLRLEDYKLAIKQQGHSNSGQISVCRLEVLRCSSNRFGINMCSDWCNVADIWRGCKINTLAGSHEANTDSVDYTCSC